MMKKYSINQTTLEILGLYRSNYSISVHVREVARETQVDFKAVLLQLKKLEKTHIVISTKKGRNKEYTLNLNNYLAKYYIVLAETYKSITYLSENFEVKKVITEIGDKLGGNILLFGSFAKGNMTPESDIDLLVIGDKKPDLNSAQELGGLMGRQINVKFTTEAKFLEGLISHDPLIQEAVANHIILKGIDNICDLMWRYYARR
jgi:predicted nucleotidyltransferase